MIEPKKQTAVAPTAACTNAPPFDLEEFRGYFEHTGLSEEQQFEYLKVLWSIMATFVEMGFGVDSVQQVLPALEEKDLEPEGPGAEQLSNEG